ncbi:MAG: DUF4838 domain-containing protein [Lentisphaerae bacterium]|nr:DUF4838 domain-containing protein [Lentisphaerota bacterium]
MRKIWLLFCLSLIVIVLPGAEYAVVHNWHIVLPEKATGIEKLSAGELKLHLQKSYSRPAVFNGSVPEKITLFVGLSDEAVTAGFNDVIPAEELPGKFGIYRKGNNLLFIGVDTENGRIDRLKDQCGTLSAVEYFLQKYVKVKFILPGANGIKYSGDPAVEFAAEQDCPTPAFEVRCFQRIGKGLNLADGSLYFRRRLGNAPGYAVQDYYYCFLNNWNKRFQHKKEMFALHEGRRVNGNYPRHFPCLSHPDVIPQVVSDVSAALDKNPRIKTIRFFADAPVKICECEQCADSPVGKLVQGSDHSELVYSLLCKLARELQKKDPELWFHTHTKGTSYYQPPQTEKLPPNIVMFVLTGFFEEPDYAAVRRQCQIWQQAGATVMVKGYPRAPWMKDYPIMNPHFIAGFFKNTQGYSKGSIMCEGRPNVPYTFSALNNYVHSAVVFDTSWNVDSLIREFCEFVSPGSADELEKFYNSMEKLLENASFTAEPLRNCYISFRLKTPRMHLDNALKKDPGNQFLQQLSADFAAFEKVAADAAPLIKDEEELQSIYRSFERKQAAFKLAETPEKIDFLPFSIYYDFQKSHVEISRCGKELCVEVFCQENMMDKLKTSCRNNHNGPVWNDDSIELFIAGADGLPYIQLVVNPLGTYRAMYADKNGKVTDQKDFVLITGGAIGQEQWSMLIKVPLTAVAEFAGPEGKVNIGVYRNRPARGKDGFQQSGVQMPAGKAYKDRSGHFTVEL